MNLMDVMFQRNLNNYQHLWQKASPSPVQSQFAFSLRNFSPIGYQKRDLSDHSPSFLDDDVQQFQTQQNLDFTMQIQNPQKVKIKKNQIEGTYYQLPFSLIKYDHLLRNRLGATKPLMVVDFQNNLRTYGREVKQLKDKEIKFYNIPSTSQSTIKEEQLSCDFEVISFNFEKIPIYLKLTDHCFLKKRRITSMIRTQGTSEQCKQFIFKKKFLLPFNSKIEGILLLGDSKQTPNIKLLDNLTPAKGQKWQCNTTNTSLVAFAKASRQFITQKIINRQSQ